MKRRMFGYIYKFFEYKMNLSDVLLKWQIYIILYNRLVTDFIHKYVHENQNKIFVIQP